MMPICGYKKLFGRYNRVAETNIGSINTGDEDGFGKSWMQQHYLCDHHWRKLLKTLGFAAPSTPEDVEVR